MPWHGAALGGMRACRHTENKCFTYLLIWHYNLKIFLTETQYNVKGKMMSCFLALMALDIDEIKPLLKKGANLTLALRELSPLLVQKKGKCKSR